MNKRLKKKSEKMRRAALHRILNLTLDINGMQESKKSVTGNHPTTFLWIYGHTAKIEVDIHSRGWKPDESADNRFSCSFANDNFGDTPMQMAEKLEKYKEELEV